MCIHIKLKKDYLAHGSVLFYVLVTVLMLNVPEGCFDQVPH